jgi:hypothetical protein
VARKGKQSYMRAMEKVSTVTDSFHLNTDTRRQFQMFDAAMEFLCNDSAGRQKHAISSGVSTGCT